MKENVVILNSQWLILVLVKVQDIFDMYLDKTADETKLTC